MKRSSLPSKPSLLRRTDRWHTPEPQTSLSATVPCCLPSHLPLSLSLTFRDPAKRAPSARFYNRSDLMCAIVSSVDDELRTGRRHERCRVGKDLRRLYVLL